MEEKKSKEQLAKEVTDKLKKIDELQEVENLVKDNKIEFECKGKTYRVKKPNYKERLELQRLRSLKKQELLMDKAYKFRQQWIEQYKEKGIDIEKMDKDIAEIYLQIDDIKLQIGGTESIEVKKKLSKDIEDLELTINKLIINKKDYLEFSIEDIITEFSNIAMVAMVLEKKEEDKWIKAFKDIDDLLINADDLLLVLASNYIGALIFNPNL